MHASENVTSPDAILARVQDVFRAELDDDDLVIGLDTSQADLKAWDSLAHIRLVSGIESEFDIQFNLAEIEQITSVRQFVELIGEQLAVSEPTGVGRTCCETAAAGSAVAAAPAGEDAGPTSAAARRTARGAQSRCNRWRRPAGPKPTFGCSAARSAAS